MQERRIHIALKSGNPGHRVAMRKLETYDKSRYASMTDYIVQAIAAYEEPVAVQRQTLIEAVKTAIADMDKPVRSQLLHSPPAEEQERAGECAEPHLPYETTAMSSKNSPAGAAEGTAENEAVANGAALEMLEHFFENEQENE